jgi:beta-glucosidase
VYLCCYSPFCLATLCTKSDGKTFSEPAPSDGAPEEHFVKSFRGIPTAGLAAAVVMLSAFGAVAQSKDSAKQPWMNKALDPDKRADLMIHEMTLDEKIQLVHGDGWGVLRAGDRVAPTHNGGAGFVPGIPRLGLPDINLADSAVGARMAARESRYATLLPSVIGMASSWDPKAARLYGSVIGRELRDMGYNMSIGGGMDLIREPRNGRNFEYASEDPLLSGIMVGELASGVQDNHIMGDIKHYALNDQETGRNSLNAIMSKRTMHETDLLSFEIGIKAAKPAGVMCSYNRVNGDYACENAYLLNDVLKKEWGFKGFVVSDWEATHSVAKAALAGLDMEQPGIRFFGPDLKQAVQDGKVPQARLDDMVHRIVRSMFAVGAIDNPPVRRVVDPFQGRDDAQYIEEESAVLLKNADNVLPLKAGELKSIAIIGDHADTGVLSGGGSAQVDAPGGLPGGSKWGQPVYFPSSPLKYIKEHAGPDTNIRFNDGTDHAKAAKLAASAQVAIVFVTQWTSEGKDSATLSLPNNQDALVQAVAKANPHTIVVLENGGPVNMPWAGEVKGILEAWYPGIGGAQAIANLLFGTANPSGKLPVTFAAHETDLPHPQVTGLTTGVGNNGMNGAAAGKQPRDFPVDYNVEGMLVGYKWFQAKDKQPLFPFGFGLSYTQFAYSGLKIESGAETATLEVKNTGAHDGEEIAEVYVTLPNAAGEPFRKLAGWKRVSLVAGASQKVTVAIEPLVLSTYSEEKNEWQRPAGEYRFEAGGASSDLPLHETVTLK